MKYRNSPNFQPISQPCIFSVVGHPCISVQPLDILATMRKKIFARPSVSPSVVRVCPSLLLRLRKIHHKILVGWLGGWFVHCTAWRLAALLVQSHSLLCPAIPQIHSIDGGGDGNGRSGGLGRGRSVLICSAARLSFHSVSLDFMLRIVRIPLPLPLSLPPPTFPSASDASTEKKDADIPVPDL